MRGRKRSLVICSVLTLAAALLVTMFNRTPEMENPIFFQFPLQMGDWSGVEYEMEDYVYQGIETPYLFLRDYQSPRHEIPVNLAMVWFDDTNIAFHTPESCLGGVGAAVRLSSTADLETGTREPWPVRKLLVDHNDTPHLVLYYFDVDGFMTTSQARIRLQVLKRRVLFKRTSASFIRIMAPIIDSEEETMSAMTDFIREVRRESGRYMYTENIGAVPRTAGR